MRFRRISMLELLAFGTAACALVADAQTHESATPMPMPANAPDDARRLVRFPEPMRLHTIANMRDHLLSLLEIDEALATGDFDKASRIAEQRLGLSSLEAHDAAHLAAYMPQAMQDIGTRMHRPASRFAVEAQNAGASNDLRPALAALSQVMRQCVACDAAFRLH